MCKLSSIPACPKPVYAKERRFALPPEKKASRSSCCGRLLRIAYLLAVFLLHAALYIGRVQQVVRLFAAGGTEELLIKSAANLALL